MGWISDIKELITTLGLVGGLLALLLFWWVRSYTGTKDAILTQHSSVAYDRRFIPLKKNSFAQGYRLLLQSLLNWLAAVMGDEGRAIEERALGKAWEAPTAWSFSSYMAMLGLAVSYPIIFLTSGWLLGGSGGLGGLQLLSAETSLWQRWVFVGSLFFSIAFVAIGSRFEYTSLALLGLILTVIVVINGAFDFAIAVAVAIALAFAFAGILSGAFAFVGAFAGAGAFVGALAGAFAFAGAFAGFGAFAFAGTFGFAGALAGAYLSRQFARSVSLSWLTALSFPTLLLGLFAMDGQNAIIAIGKDEAAFILLLALLPTANAVLDWISLSVSRLLLNRIADGRHGWLSGVCYALVDAVLAVVFLGLVGLSTATAIAFAQRLHSLGGAEAVIDTMYILEGIRAAPLSADYAWIYFMLLTTLIPTALHFVAAVISAATVVFAQPIRGRILAAMELGHQGGDSDAARWAASAYASMQTTGLAIALGGLFTGGWAAYTYAQPVGFWLIENIITVVAWINIWDGAPFF